MKHGNRSQERRAGRGCPVGWDALMDELEDISLSLLLASGNGRPGTLTPAHSRLAAGALRHTAIDDRVADLSLRTVVRQFDARVTEEAKIVLARPAFESAGQCLGQGMIWRPKHASQKALLDGSHLSDESLFTVPIPPMKGVKQLLEPGRQLLAPASQSFRAVFGQESDVPNQVSHAILDPGVEEPSILAIGASVVTANDAGKLLPQDPDQHLAAARGIDAEQAVERRLKTPRLMESSFVFVAGLINAQMRLLRQTVPQLLIGLLQGLRDLLRGLTEYPTREILLEKLHRFLAQTFVRLLLSWRGLLWLDCQVQLSAVAAVFWHLLASDAILVAVRKETGYGEEVRD